MSTNRQTLALTLAVGMTIGAEVVILTADARPPLWLVAAPVAWLCAALWAVARVYPPGPTLAEQIAAESARAGPPGAGFSFAAYWPVELPPVPGMITAPYPGHEHGGPGPCPACLVMVEALAASVGATVEIGERLADTADIHDARMLAEVIALVRASDADARAYMADYRVRALDLGAELGAPLEGVVICGERLGEHVCTIRGQHTPDGWRTMHVCGGCPVAWGGDG